MIAVLLADAERPTIVVEKFESNLAADNKLARGFSTITLIFTATDTAVLPEADPTDDPFVRGAGATGTVALVSNEGLFFFYDRRYTYVLTLDGSVLNNATIGYSIKLPDFAGNDGTSSSAPNELITIGAYSLLYESLGHAVVNTVYYALNLESTADVQTVSRFRPSQ